LSRVPVRFFLTVLSIVMLGLAIFSYGAVTSAGEHYTGKDYIENYTRESSPAIGEALVEIIFSENLPSSYFQTITAPPGGADVEIFLQDCCIRDDVVEVYVDDCFVARVDSQGGDFGTHPGETHIVSLEEGTHTIEYRNVFSLFGPSGWSVNTTLQPFTGDSIPCGIKSIEVICRPLSGDPNDELHITEKVGRHCYFLVEDFLGNESTYGAYNVNDRLTPVKNASSDLLDAVPCGTGFLIGPLESVCKTVDPPQGQTLNSIVDHLEQAIAVGPDGTYHRITNNSNLWLKQRINELSLGISLPNSAITGRLDVAQHLPFVIAELVACGVDALVIDQIKCKIFDVCQ